MALSHAQSIDGENACQSERLGSPAKKKTSACGSQEEIGFKVSCLPRGGENGSQISVTTGRNPVRKGLRNAKSGCRQERNLPSLQSDLRQEETLGGGV